MISPKVSIHLSANVLGLMDAMGVRVMTFNEMLNEGNHGIDPHYFFTAGGVFQAATDTIGINDYGITDAPVDEIALHELCHWSGGRGRMNRPAIVIAQDIAYLPINEAVRLIESVTLEMRHTEEATAQLGAFYLSKALGMDDQLLPATERYINRMYAANMTQAIHDAGECVSWILSNAVNQRAA